MPWEARRLQGQRAGVVTRTAANVVDFLLVVSVLALAYVAWCAVAFLVNPTHFRFPAPSLLLALILFELVLFCYFTACWTTTGRTLGDHQPGLRVVDAHGEQLGWFGATLRSVLCVVLPIGLYWAALSSTNRSVQDVVLGSSVIYDWTIRTRRLPRASPAPGELSSRGQGQRHRHRHEVAGRAVRPVLRVADAGLSRSVAGGFTLPGRGRP